MSINLHNDKYEDSVIRHEAEEQLKNEYMSLDNSLGWRLKQAMILWGKNRLIKKIMEKLATEKKQSHEENKRKADDLIAQLNDWDDVNTDRTPVWNISDNKLAELRKAEFDKQIKELVGEEITVNKDRTPVWNIDEEELERTRFAKIKESLKKLGTKTFFNTFRTSNWKTEIARDESDETWKKRSKTYKKINVNTDRTPVWNINEEDVAQARRNQIEQQL